MHRVAAILALLSLLAPRLTRGEEALVYVAPVPAPAKASSLAWQHGMAPAVPGVWLTAPQEVKVGTKILSCQGALDASLDQNARCEVALAEARGNEKIDAVPWWTWLAGGIVAGIAATLAVKGATK